MPTDKLALPEEPLAHGRSRPCNLCSRLPFLPGTQRPGPPVWIGGNTGRARRRAAELGDGWFPIWHGPTGRGFTPSALREAVARLGEEAARFERPGNHSVGGLLPLALTDGPVNIDPLSPSIGAPSQVADELSRLGEAGLDHAVLSPFYGVEPKLLPADLDAVGRLLEDFAETVRPQVG